MDKRTDVTFGTASRVRSREDVLILRRVRERGGGHGGKKSGAFAAGPSSAALHPRRAGGSGAPAETTAGGGGGLGSLQGGEGALRGLRETQGDAAAAKTNCVPAVGSC